MIPTNLAMQPATMDQIIEWMRDTTKYRYACINGVVYLFEKIPAQAIGGNAEGVSVSDRSDSVVPQSAVGKADAPTP